MRARGLVEPLVVVSDGAPGIIKTIEICFPRSARQRCLINRMRNLADRVPEDSWPEVKARCLAAYRAPSRAFARDLAAGVVGDYEKELSSAIARCKDDFAACIAHPRMPVNDRRAIRITNLPERLFVEERRRVNITVTDPDQFRTGRQFATWLGLTSKRHPTGGKTRLGGISKLGDRYQRRLLVVGAAAVMRHAKDKATPMAAWVREVLEKKSFRLVSVALANKPPGSHG